jgi:hypothetical protein
MGMVQLDNPLLIPAVEGLVAVETAIADSELVSGIGSFLGFLKKTAEVSEAVGNTGASVSTNLLKAGAGVTTVTMAGLKGTQLIADQAKLTADSVRAAKQSIAGTDMNVAPIQAIGGPEEPITVQTSKVHISHDNPDNFDVNGIDFLQLSSGGSVLDHAITQAVTHIISTVQNQLSAGVIEEDTEQTRKDLMYFHMPGNEYLPSKKGSSAVMRNVNAFISR